MPKLFQVLKCESRLLVTGMVSPELRPMLELPEPVECEPDYYLLIAPRKSTLRTSGKKWQRQAIIRRDGNRCWICKADFTVNNPSTLDHVLELSLGGKDRLDNLKLAHQTCNSSRSQVNGTPAVLALARLKQHNQLRSA